MIGIFHRSHKDQNIKPIDSFQSGSWVYVESPSSEELEHLVNTFDLDMGLLSDGVDLYEVPRMEINDGKIYIFTRLPSRTDENVVTVPMLIVFGADFVLTLSRERHPFFRKMIGGGADLYPSQKTTMLIYIFSEILKLYDESLFNIRRRVRAAGAHIENITNQDIANFLAFEGTVNDFLSDLVPTNSILSHLLSGKLPKDLFKLYEADNDLIEDLLLSSSQLIDLCKSSLKNIVVTRDSYSIVMTNKLNRSIKLLTILTVSFMIPGVVAGFFGMNVVIPFASSGFSFWLVILLSVILSGGVFYWLTKRDRL